MSAGLTDELALDLVDAAGDGLAVSDARPADVGLDLEVAEHSSFDDVEMKFAHASDDELAGFGIGVIPEGGVFLGEPSEDVAELLLVGAALGLDGHADDRFGEVDLFEDDGVMDGAEGVAGDGVFETDGGDDISGLAHFDGLADVGVHAPELGEVLFLVLSGVEDALAGLDDAGVDAEINEVGVLVGGDFERERGQGLVGRRLALDLFLAVGNEADDGRDVQGTGQIVDHRVEEGLHALVFQAGAADDRHEQVRKRALAQARTDLFF